MVRPTTTPPAPQLRFARTFLLPALSVFLVPVLALAFFRHAEARFDADGREAVLTQIRADAQMTPEERARAEEFFARVPFSDLVRNEKAAAGMRPDAVFRYATFRWMIRLAVASLVASALVVALGGLCVLLANRSQRAQYAALSAGWNVLRIFGALQAVAQGAMLVALSFWVTALWANLYSLKLIAVVAIVAVVAVAAVVYAVFKRLDSEFAVEGRVLTPAEGEAAPVWAELGRICAAVGTAPPDQIVAGIDDNFFVTEGEVTVGGAKYTGRTLFVSLSLLKQLSGGEADAVLAHEMAHFSGQDTFYSAKIAPLLRRYDHYLVTLRDGGVTLPIYYFMNCFRALYELSLRRAGRAREFRADAVAAAATSPADTTAALLRTTAYSRYRAEVENELFGRERVLESADVQERVEAGFPDYAAKFLTAPGAAESRAAHPFDSHPPLAERLVALGVALDSAGAAAPLASPGDGRWYHALPGAAELERGQWATYEERFRAVHEQTLPYRLLPETPDEAAVVAKFFPPLSFSGPEGELRLDYQQLALDGWAEPLRYADISGMGLSDKKVLTITHAGGKQKLGLAKFPDPQGVIAALNRYYGRARAATEYRRAKGAAGA